MNVYDVCLETSAEGLCMAHVPNLPGCFARGRGREEVLARLPRTIAEYHDWLADHGESAAVCSNGFSRVFPGRGPKAAEAATTNGGEEIEIRVVEETGAVGPFHAGDAAALFAADHEPVGPGEMEDYFRWMGYARADLLALVRHLPPDLLDWQPFPEWFSIGQVLRHVGNAEEWYVSRLVPPERLPPEWDDDEGLPLFDFLEMERRTALARLRGLTAEERGGVFYPTAWTRHPDEAWTLRKVLRRFLEHEREHTAQVREILDLGLRGVMARGAAQDTRLLELLLGLDERTLAREPVIGDRTAQDMLAYLAARDRWEQQALMGEEPDLAPETIEDVDVQGDGTWLELHLVELAVEREAWRMAVLEVPENALFSAEAPPRAMEAVVARMRRLEAHIARLATWRKQYAEVEGSVPSVAVLKAALAAGRLELLSAMALVPGGDRAARAVCGIWTLKDVVGHMADWEWLGVDGLRHMASRHATGPLPVEHITDLDGWNEAHVGARRDQPWRQVWTDFERARQSLHDVLKDMDAAALSRRFLFPWGSEGTAYDWLCIYLRHDREHAAGLRAVLTLPEVYSSL